MKLKITKRDVLFFFVGVFTVIIIDTVVNWEDSKEAFREGFEEGMNRDK